VKGVELTTNKLIRVLPPSIPALVSAPSEVATGTNFTLSVELLEEHESVWAAVALVDERLFESHPIDFDAALRSYATDIPIKMNTINSKTVGLPEGINRCCIAI
jgi:hypothetical protein